MSDAVERARYVLPLSGEQSLFRGQPTHDNAIADVEDLLLKNQLWYCQLRWIVAVIFAVFGVLSYVPGFFGYLELRSHIWWPFVVAATLAIANLSFLSHARYSRRPTSSQANLWAQIAFDLLVVTASVHLIGSVETHISSVYLFHVVLSCIFLSRRQSLLVTVLACLLYATCLALEHTGVLPQVGVYAARDMREHMDEVGVPLLSALGLSVMTWLVVWYLASDLSALVRKRERELEEANRRLVAVQLERMQHMLHTTHELKAPFAAIQANTQLLLKGYCGALEQDARDVVQRISDRSEKLAGGIQRMLQLANLRSQTQAPIPKWIDIGATLQASITQVSQIAQAHSVEVAQDIKPVRTLGVEDHLKMLFMNLVSNALLYSQVGGNVRVACAKEPDGRGVVTIEDHGIGIPADKLPKVFDEYYRTNEAVKHNKNSTGLGLAIVRHVAEEHDVSVTVESAPNAGTRVTLTFPDPRSIRHARTA